MAINKKLNEITQRIISRSKDTRLAYLKKIERAQKDGPNRAHLSCGNQAHAYAAMGNDKSSLLKERSPNIGIISAYNDMLSAHQPFETYPSQIKAAARKFGATAQFAAGVPAMCDGVTQGQSGMELSLFSRETIALSAAIGLSHNTFDAVIFLGVCDKIIPGLVIATATFGNLPSVFLPAGPMSSGITNDKNVSDLESLQLKSSFIDLNEKNFDLSVYKGKKIIINYWATWCGPCIKEMPSIKRAEEILEDYDYTFLLVSDETISKISKFKNDRNFDFKFLKSIKSYESLGIYSMPTSYIFDENGKKIETIVGTITWDSEQIINKLKIL